MTAYGAVLSLKNTLEYILHSSHISLVEVEPSLHITQLYNELQLLQEILQRLDITSPSRSRKKVNVLDGRIKDAVWKFEDSLDSLLTDQILSQLQSPSLVHRRILPLHTPNGEALQSARNFNTPRIMSKYDGSQPRSLEYSHLGKPIYSQDIPGFLAQFIICCPDEISIPLPPQCECVDDVRDESDIMLFSVNVQSLQDDVCSLIQMLKEMEKEYIYELDNMPEDDEATPAVIGFGGTNSKMIGLSDQFKLVISHLVNNCEQRVYSLVGMAGVGKTTLAQEIYQDPEIQTHFHHQAWVTLGRKPQLEQLVPHILTQLCVSTEEDEDAGDKLEKRSKGMNCLIVVDDVWEQQVMHSLVNSTLSLIPRTNYGCIAFLLTTRDRSLTPDTRLPVLISDPLVVRFLNEEESKELLCHKVFDDGVCPPHLDKAATKISKKCEGLPLLIVTVADFISKSENSTDPEYWSDVAEERNSVFRDAYDKISKVLFPSYDYLPQYLKMPFLHMGVFPLEYDTPPSKIMNMLYAEGWFLDTSKKQSFEHSVWGCLDELCMNKNLVLFKRKSTFWYKSFHSFMLKTCRLHSSWQYVCREEARKNKFYHVLKRLDDGSEGILQGLRCLCLENNILFGIKEFCNSLQLNCASSARSLLFFGPYQKYPIPLDVGFKLLRELDALKQRFYSFPTEILMLVHLKYLALTCNGQLPATISKLFNLAVLIIHPHMNIRRCGAPQFVPTEIWDMKELEHIEILGNSLVAPSHVASLERLATLVGVNADIGTITNLTKKFLI